LALNRAFTGFILSSQKQNAAGGCLHGLLTTMTPKPTKSFNDISVLFFRNFFRL